MTVLGEARQRLLHQVAVQARPRRRVERVIRQMTSPCGRSQGPVIAIAGTKIQSVVKISLTDLHIGQMNVTRTMTSKSSDRPGLVRTPSAADCLKESAVGAAKGFA
jgi:hypothetical protein